MANKNKSATNDPASLAFSAVENALKDSILTEPTEKNAKAKKPTPPAPQERGRAREDAAGKIAQRTGKVANDDGFSPSRLMYGMNKRPSQTPIILATIGSLIWVGLNGLIAWMRHGDKFADPALLNEFISSNEMMGILAVMTLPVFGIFAVAILARRAQDLRIAASSMTSAAIRLAEPETTAADKVATVGQAVRREVNALGDGLERALSRASELEVMIHNEVTALDKTYTENESRMRGLIQELASQRDSVITNSERVREAISESHSGLVFDLDMIAQRIAGTIEERGGELTKALDVAGDGLQTQFSSKTDSFISLVDGRTVDLLSALDDSAGRLNLALEDRTATISGAFEERTQGLASVIDLRMSGITEALDSRAVALNEAIEERTASISSVLRDGGGKILTDLRERGHEVGSALDAIGLRVANEISGRAGEAETTLTRLTQQMDEVVSAQINGLDSRFQTALLEISGTVEGSAEEARSSILAAGAQSVATFDTRINQVTAIIDERLHSLDNVILDKGGELSKALELYATNFADRANVLELALDEKSGRFNDQIIERTNDLSNTLSSRSGILTENMQAVASQLTETIESNTESFTATLESKTSGFNSAIEAQTAHITDTLESKSAGFNEAMAAQAAQITGTMESKTAGFSSTIESQTAHFTNTVSERTATIAETIAEQTAQAARSLESQAEIIGSAIEDQAKGVSNSIQQSASSYASTVQSQHQTLNQTLISERDAMDQSLSQNAEHITNIIGGHTKELADVIDQHGLRARDRIDASLQAVTDTMDTRSTELTTIIGSKVNEVNDSLGRGIDSALSRISDAETGISVRVEQAASKVAEASEATAEMIETGVTEARKAITDMVDQRLGTLPEAITARADITADRLTTLNNNINSSMQKSLTELEHSAEKIERTISTRIVDAASGISEHVSQTTNSMDNSVRVALEMINQVADRFNTLVSKDAAETARSLGAKVEEINTNIDESTSRFSTLITDKSSELSQSLNSHTNVLREALSASASEAEALMATSTSRISSEVNVSLERLNESNRLLQEVLVTSTGNLSQLETSIGRHTSVYTDAVREATSSTENAGRMVAEHVGAMQSSIKSIVSEFGDIVGKLDVEAHQIDASARNLSEAGQASLANVEARREAMDALAQGFMGRADDIDARLRTFAEEIASTVADTERRLAGARDAMDSALNSTSQSVLERLNDMSEIANTQGSRTSDALRDTQQAMLNEMQVALSEATNRFNQTAEDMQSTARQVGSELEMTRGELQRGFMELPEETRASAAAMRSVVAEQIEALNELNSIVSAQPRSHEVSRGSFASSPTPALSQQPAPRAEAPRQEAAPRFSSAPAPQAPTRDYAPTPAPSAPRQEADNNGGWLKDVLRNASANQQASVASPARGSGLTSLTSDIARAIDTHALGEAWERYQAGESNVFSRRIYTLSGQGTYDEVRRKLQREPDFESTAREYIAEFEQAIKRARNASEARQVLTSDEGKVFTMLAHASGRLN